MNSDADLLSSLYALGSYYHDRPAEAWDRVFRMYQRRAELESRHLTTQIAELRGKVDELRNAG